MDGDLFNDPDFENLLAAMRRTAPDLTKASMMKPNPSLSLAKQVEERCAFPEAGFKLQVITGTPLAQKGIVPLQNPPVTGGVMHCVNELKRIVIDEYEMKKAAEFQKVCSPFSARNIVR